MNFQSGRAAILLNGFPGYWPGAVTRWRAESLINIWKAPLASDSGEKGNHNNAAVYLLVANIEGVTNMEPIVAFLAALVVGYVIARSGYSKPVQETTDRFISRSFDYVGKVVSAVKKIRPPGP